MSTTQDFKTTFKYNLTCIFLSLTAQFKKHFARGHPKYINTKKEGRTENLLGPDNNFEFLKHFMNILLKN